MTTVVTSDPRLPDSDAAAGASFTMRDATPSDNEALIELTAACTMNGDIGLRVDRAPDFFALNRLEGHQSRVGIVAGWTGAVVGCIAVAARRSYVNGVPEHTVYVGDLKVHPVARGSGVADMLTHYARIVSTELCGPTVPIICTILAGNRAMENRARGPRGVAALSRFAALSVFAVPLLWERGERMLGIDVREATECDLEAMAMLWRRFAERRQFAEVIDASALKDWIRRAPGLSISDYLIAIDASGRMLGFMGVWDQREFKQMRVDSYSRRLGVARHAINMLAPLSGSARLPNTGAVLPALATVHVCADEPRVLRALLLEAYRRYRGPHYSFITVGLDARDPRCDALRGLLAQPTRVNAYVTNPGGHEDPAPYTQRLLHYETALV